MFLRWSSESVRPVNIFEIAAFCSGDIDFPKFGLLLPEFAIDILFNVLGECFLPLIGPITFSPPSLRFRIFIPSNRAARIVTRSKSPNAEACGRYSSTLVALVGAGSSASTSIV